MAGFKNAPGITEFERGMVFTVGGRKSRVEWVDVDGQAHCSSVPDIDGVGHVKMLWALPILDLDLGSIWEGREYRYKGDTNTPVTVLAISDTHIGYKAGEWKCCRCIKSFRTDYEPIPLPQFDEAAHPDPECACVGVAEKPWMPKIGDKVAWPVAGERVFVVRAIFRDDGGTLRATIESNRAVINPVISDLRPLPPEPPVKMGDYVLLTAHGYERVGKVNYVDNLQHLFRLDPPVTNDAPYDWDNKSITITKLTPATK